MKKTKIVATIGPASDSKKNIKKLVKEGMDVVRLNFSHGNYEYFEEVIRRVREVDSTIAIMLDTKGPEIRTGQMKEGQVKLVKGQKVLLTNRKVVGTEKEISIDYKDIKTIKKGSKILLDDGLIELKVLKGGQIVEAKVLNSGILGERKTVTLLNHKIDVDFLTRKDRKDIEFGIKHGIDIVAASFVRCGKDVERLRKFLKKSPYYIPIIAKIEHWEAAKHIEEIVDGADVLWSQEEI